MGEVVVVVSGDEEVGLEREWKSRNKNKNKNKNKKKRKKKEEKEVEEINIIDLEKENNYKVEGSSCSSEVVRWEKFLPRMFLRVLLVEADGSTRQIIAALLRKCSYRVSAVPDGLMAWETLRGRPHNIDLILTEIELPSISGYALLTLIMEHEICKNIPVIMMSSQDSISVVLKCMLKGAADFLIKPIRRNELKNLWQHVWRKHSLNAGHITRGSPVIEQKVEATSENNSASNHSSACVTSLRNNRECSKKESDSQGLLQLKCVTPSNTRITERQKYEDGDKVDKGSITPESIGSGGWSNELGGKAALCNGADSETALRLGGKSAYLEAIRSQHSGSENNRGDANLHGNHVDRRVEPSNGAIDLIGTFDGSSKHSYSHHYLNDSTNKLEFAPQLELSLNRKFSTGLSSQSQAGDERHALNHSNASAFSWYNNKPLQPFCPTLSNNPSDIKEGAAKSPPRSSHHLSETRYGVSQHITISGDDQETVTSLIIGQSDQGDLVYPSSLISSASLAGVRFDNCHTSSPRALPPLYFPHASVAQAWIPEVTRKQEEYTFPTGTLKHWNSENCDLKENCKTLDEATNNAVDQSVHEQDNVEPSKEEKPFSPTAGQSSSSSLCNGFANKKSCTPYGSLCSTNDRNATSAVPAEKSMTPESSNNGGLLVRDGIRGMDSQHLSQREAALTKFRLKRKDRCFEKKVRYQSRKRLAEQRPRVKGQFVRQVQDTTMADANP